MNSIELRIELSSKEKLESAVSAIKHEEEFKKRTDSKVTIHEKEIVINLKSLDVVSLRAAINAYLRCFQIIKDVEKLDEGA